MNASIAMANSSRKQQSRSNAQRSSTGGHSCTRKSNEGKKRFNQTGSRIAYAILFIFMTCSTLLSVEAASSLVPLSVRIIDLEKLIGLDANSALDALVMNQSTCVLLIHSPETQNTDIVLFDTDDEQVISATTVTNADVLQGHYWCEGNLYLWLQPSIEENTEKIGEHVEVRITQGRQVSISIKKQEVMVMPGGEIGVFGAPDGSLVALNLMSNSTELLLQGVPDNLSSDRDDLLAYLKYLQYVPHLDEIGYSSTNENVPPFTHPLSESDFHENEVWLWRYYEPFEPIDEHRFVYAVAGWEWNAGYGIYDMENHVNYRIAGDGMLLGRRGARLFGSNMETDVETYHSRRLPLTMRELLSKIADQEDHTTSFDLSPNGELLAIAGSKTTGNATISILSTQTGNTQSIVDIPPPFSSHECRVSFLNDTSVLLLYLPTGNEVPIMYIVALALGNSR